MTILQMHMLWQTASVTALSRLTTMSPYIDSCENKLLDSAISKTLNKLLRNETIFRFEQSNSNYSHKKAYKFYVIPYQRRRDRFRHKSGSYLYTWRVSYIDLSKLIYSDTQHQLLNVKKVFVEQTEKYTSFVKKKNEGGSYTRSINSLRPF